MGKLAGAAATVAAPQVKVAAAAAGGARRRPPAADPRVTAPGSNAAQQRQAIEDIKAARPEEPSPAAGDGSTDQASSPAPTSPRAGLSAPSVPGVPASVSTGSGFLLGVFVWAVGLAYLQDGGMNGVRKFLKAKFLNQTEGVAR